MHKLTIIVTVTVILAQRVFGEVFDRIKLTIIVCVCWKLLRQLSIKWFVSVFKYYWWMKCLFK